MEEESGNGTLIRGIAFILALIIWGIVSDIGITIFVVSTKLGFTTFSQQMISMMSGSSLVQTGRNIETFVEFFIDFVVAVFGAIGTVLLMDKISKLILGFFDLIAGIFSGGD